MKPLKIAVAFNFMIILCVCERESYQSPAAVLYWQLIQVVTVTLKEEVLIIV